MTNNYRFAKYNKNITVKGVKELGVNISKLTNITELNLNLDE